VGILAVTAGHHADAAVIAAARCAAAAEDPRIQRVLDVLTDDDGTCVVIEWIAATSLEDLLSEGPLPDEEALRITLEVASALAVVGFQGLHHGALSPAWVLRADDGRIRLSGLSIAGALAGGGAHARDRVRDSGREGVRDGAPDPAAEANASAADAQRLGAVLYASLTGRWPVGEPTAAGVVSAGTPTRSESRLPDAPTQGGRPVRARMVRAGVPPALDDVAARALGLSARGRPLATAAAVAEALRDAADRMGGVDLDHPTALDFDPPVRGPAGLGGPPGGRSDMRRDRRPGSGRAAVLAAFVLVLALVGGGVLAAQALINGRTKATPAANPTAASTQPTTPAPTPVAVPVASISLLEPPGSHIPDDPAGAKNAIDGNLATSWNTIDYYNFPKFGNAKPGVGLLLDLGRVTSVDKVTVNLIGNGTSLALLASGVRAPTYVSYLEISNQTNAGSSVTLVTPGPDFRARYLVIWLTKLPPAAGPANVSTYAGGIREIQVFGH
jgi:hypothetical protein